MALADVQFAWVGLAPERIAGAVKYRGVLFRADSRDFVSAQNAYDVEYLSVIFHFFFRLSGGQRAIVPQNGFLLIVF